MKDLKLKKVDGMFLPAEDFAYVPDPEKPSTWKLPIFDMRHVGAAEAALDSDYRGEQVEIPEEDLPEVKRKVAERKAALLSSRAS